MCVCVYYSFGSCVGERVKVILGEFLGRGEGEASDAMPCRRQGTGINLQSYANICIYTHHMRAD